MKTWRATCGVCEASWKVEGEENPAPTGSFCPDCKKAGRMAPGVLNWKPDSDPIEFTYKNYRGEVSRRRVRPLSIRVGSSEYHPEPQLLMLAYDLDKEAEREFAVKDMDFRDEADISGDVYVDENQTTWTRPTAYAYAQACKARDKWQEDSRLWIENVEAMLSDGDADVVRVHEGGGPEDLRGSLAVTMIRTRKTRDKALRHIGELLFRIKTMVDSAKPFLDRWSKTGFSGFVKRAREGHVIQVYVGEIKSEDVRRFIESHQDGH